ncbi:Aldehyde dehydrogenase OS=Streptomyces antimycoticus OX=68175 GN=SSPO_098330 PE=3 SV=1 [Streptomyces antimycoticus]
MEAPATEDVRFPYDGTLVAGAPIGDTALARHAVDAALAVRERVGRLPSHVRRGALLATHEALASRRADFERLLVLETGKPLVDCRGGGGPRPC